MTAAGRSDAVLLALASAATFGAMTVAIRAGLRDGDAAGAARWRRCCPRSCWRSAAAAARHDVTGAWRFWLAGLARPRHLAAPLHVGGTRRRRLANVGCSRCRRPCSLWRSPSPSSTSPSTSAARPRRLRDRRRRRGARSRARPSGPSAPARHRLCPLRGGPVRGPGQHRAGAARPPAARRRPRRRRCWPGSSSPPPAPARADAARGATTRSGRDPVGLSYLFLFEAYFHGRVRSSRRSSRPSPSGASGWRRSSSGAPGRRASAGARRGARRRRRGADRGGGVTAGAGKG